MEASSQLMIRAATALSDPLTLGLTAGSVIKGDLVFPGMADGRRQARVQLADIQKRRAHPNLQKVGLKFV